MRAVEGKRLRVAILGTGNIGTDLLLKVSRSLWLECCAFVGRSANSQGLRRAAALEIPTSTASIDFLVDRAASYDLVFDATSARGHRIHAPVFRQLGKVAIDLTPAHVGEFCVPAVNLAAGLTSTNLNTITCGGQASIPVAYAIGQTQQDVEYIEVVSSIASRSAGPATRANLDEYIHTTEHGLRYFSGAQRCKAILNLNPAEPCIYMQTTIMAKVQRPNIAALLSLFHTVVAEVKTYVPGYEILVGPIVDHGRIVVTIRVAGLGDYLPRYAGNLDIINCAAIAMAEQIAKQGVHRRKGEVA